jgi:hypothetical protein
MMSGQLLDVLHDTNNDEMIRNFLSKSKIFGVSVFGDDALLMSLSSRFCPQALKIHLH